MFDLGLSDFRRYQDGRYPPYFVWCSFYFHCGCELHRDQTNLCPEHWTKFCLAWEVAPF